MITRINVIDPATRYCVTAIPRNKESFETLETVCKYWLSNFEAPRNFLTDNGTEFNNFQYMRQKLNIVVKITTAENHWNSGLNVRHN